jgi:hypothetical protein
MAAPRVTLAMPVYNSRADRFEAALTALLAQDFGDFELLLSDNGSNDEARALYEAAARRDPRIRLHRHAENHGAVFNFNYLFSRGRGQYFKWAADDDWVAPTWLGKTVALLERDRAAVSAGSWFALVDDAGQQVGSARPPARFARRQPWQRIAVTRDLAPGDYLDVYSLHRRAALEHTHLSQAIHGADALMMMEMLLQGTVVHVEEELFRYHVPARYNMDTLATAMLGSQAKPMLFRHPLQHLALQMLVSVATTRVPLVPSVRAACLTSLGASLVWHGWLTVEQRIELQRRAADSAFAGQPVRSAALLLESLATSPQALVQWRDWRALASIFRHHPARKGSAGERGA